MSLFIDPNKSFISIDTYIIELVKPHGHSVLVFINSKKEFDEWHEKGYFTEEEIEELKKSNTSYDQTKIIQKIITTWKRLNWKEHNQILNKSLTTVVQQDGGQSKELNVVIFNDLKLKTCLKKWNLKNEKNEVLEVTPEAIDTLEPDLAAKLLSDFASFTEPSENDLKKSQRFSG